MRPREGKLQELKLEWTGPGLPAGSCQAQREWMGWEMAKCQGRGTFLLT